MTQFTLLKFIMLKHLPKLWMCVNKLGNFIGERSSNIYWIQGDKLYAKQSFKVLTWFLKKWWNV